MWTTEHSIETTASMQAIWRVWADVPRWSEWNPGVNHAELSGAFAAGSTISMATGDDTINLRIVEAVEPELFVDRVRFMFRTLVVRTIHRVDRLDSGRMRVVYRMEITGLLAGRFGRELGPDISADFPEVLAGLVERAERGW